MYARVITAHANENGFDDLVHSARRELPAARERPGFEGYLLLTDDDTLQALIVSLWRTREDMEAVSQGVDSGVHAAGLPPSMLASLTLTTYEVFVRS